MKKVFLALLIALMNYGCATPAVTQLDNPALISYDEIATNINVSYETTSGSYGWSRPVAANQPSPE